MKMNGNCIFLTCFIFSSKSKRGDYIVLSVGQQMAQSSHLTMHDRRKSVPKVTYNLEH